MKLSCIATLAAVLLLVSAATASASDRAVPGETLGAMGLGEMQSLSDSEGLTIRGKGTYAGVWGTSTARWGRQSSTNNYSASSSWLGKGSGATGSSFSFAGKFGGFGGFGRFGR